MEEAIEAYSIRVADYNNPVSSLSGGNQQKVIISRELGDSPPDVILAVNPTRGLDIGSIEYVHQCIRDQQAEGKTVILISNELSEIMALSNRIGVIYEGQIIKIFENTNISKEDLGYYMLGGRAQQNEIQDI